MNRLTNKQISDQREHYDRSYSSWSPKRKTTDDCDPNNNNNNNNIDVIGVKAGESTFKVPGIYEDWSKRKKRVPREDGTPWPPEEGEGGYYEPEWRSEEDRRRDILEGNPDYKFLRLVAGATGLDVTVLYEEEDLAGIFRREQGLLEAQRAGIRQTTLSIEQLDADVRDLRADLETLRERRETMGNTLVGSERYATTLAEAEISYDDTEKSIGSLNRMTTIVEVYLTVPSGGTFTQDTMSTARNQLLSETRYQLGSLAAQRLIEEGEEYTDMMKREGTEVKTDEFSEPSVGRTTLTPQTFSEYGILTKLRLLSDSDNLQGITRTLVELPMVRGSYATTYLNYVNSQRNLVILREYMEGELRAQLVFDIQEAQNKIATEKTELLRAFYDVLYFLYQNEIFAIALTDVLRIVGVPPATSAVRRLFVEGEAQNSYEKYGGTAFLQPQDPQVDITAFYTTGFNKILKERKPPEPPVVVSAEEATPSLRLYAGPFVKQMKIFNAWLSDRIDKLDDDIREVEVELESSTRRLSNLRRGEITFPDVQPPYRHRRRWVELPENSGIVRMKPIVVTAISQAFNWVKQFTPYGKMVDENFMQRDEAINTDFANLVALQMNVPLTIFPVTYRSPTIQDTVTLQKRNVGTRLQKNYRVKRDREGKYRAEFLREGADAGPTRSSLARVFGGGICFA